MGINKLMNDSRRGGNVSPTFRVSTLIPAALLFGVLMLAACGSLVDRTITVSDVTIKFNAMGGTAEFDEIVGAPFSTIVLPAASRGGGYAFQGWYSNAGVTGGKRYGGAGDYFYINERAGDTVYARWIEEGDSVIQGITVVRVRVGAGTFIMGSPLNEAGRYFDETQREVTLSSDFWIGKYPITNAQFGKDVPEGYEDHPVVGVDWFRALEFAESIGGALPTEAQWEFAARGGNIGKDSRHIYSGGDNLDAVGWFAGNSGGASRAVGQKLPNELGIYDMSGNVYEWVYDWYGYHNGDPVIDPVGPDSGEGRIHRGGGWNSPARDCRVADRAYSPPSESGDNIGFRVVFSAE